MRITDLIDKRSICLDGTPRTKAEALDQMVALMTASGKIADEEGYRKQVYFREEESTTGIGGGIAIPHGKISAVPRNLGWPLWLSGTAWNLNPWTVCRLI